MVAASLDHGGEGTGSGEEKVADTQPAQEQ